MMTTGSRRVGKLSPTTARNTEYPRRSLRYKTQIALCITLCCGASSAAIAAGPLPPLVAAIDDDVDVRAVALTAAQVELVTEVVSVARLRAAVEAAGSADPADSLRTPPTLGPAKPL